MTQVSIQSRPANRPLIAMMWLLTVVPYVLPYQTIHGLVLGALFTLVSSGIAVALLFSRMRVDRLHGFARLGVQLLTLIIGVVLLVRSGISLDSLQHLVSHSAP